MTPSHGADEEFVPGELREIADGLWRIVAPNAGLMTGPGTNTYLVRDSGGLTVIDPGPNAPGHIDAIVSLAPAAITLIAVTHTHRDHSPGATPLAQRTGAPLAGLAPPPTPENEQGFTPDFEPQDGAEIAAGSRLRAVHTPGHASNHVCLYDPANARLFTGDHLMGGSTVVIAPPDGNMRAYLESLQRLKPMALSEIAPGHGPLLSEPQRIIQWTIDHRLEREAMVFDAVAAAESATLDELLPVVYAAVDPALHPVARRSLEAHLEKLADDRRLETVNGRWRTFTAEPMPEE